VTKTLTINIWLAHSPHESKAHVITLRRTIIQVSSSPLLSMAGLLRYYAGSRTVFWPISQRPLGHKRPEIVPEPRGVCFKLWVIKSRSCLRHSPRSHIGDVLWNSEPDSHRQLSQCFGSAFLVFRKVRFRTGKVKTCHPKQPPEGSTFWPDGKFLNLISRTATSPDFLRFSSNLSTFVGKVLLCGGSLTSASKISF